MQKINESKKELRKKYAEIRMSLSRDEISSASTDALGHLIALPEFKKAKEIILYYPVKNEADPTAIVQVCHNFGKKTAFPKSNKQDFSLDFFCVNSKDDLSVGTYGIPEPSDFLERLVPSENTLCIVPALLCSRDGYRLGYGKGFYDRFLSVFRGKSVGFIFDRFLTDSLPADRYDQRVDIIVTEKEIIRCKK